MTSCGRISESEANTTEIDALARFSVEEHNKKENAKVEFVKVVSAKDQVVQGKMYYITVEVLEGGQPKTYEAKIWVKPWESFKELQEFKLV